MIKTFKFKKIADDRGALTPIEELRDVPFTIKRVYYMYDTEVDFIRGRHAHKTLEQVLICVHGNCKVLLDNGKNKEIIELDRKDVGLYIGPNMWREMFNFTKDCTLMVLASDYYKESDYIRKYDEFLRYIKGVQI